MIKYNPTIQNTKRYLLELSYSKCTSCKKVYYPSLSQCSLCGKKCKIIDQFKSIKLVSFTKLINNQNHLSRKKPVIIGLVELNNEIDITGEIVDLKYKNLKAGMRLKPVLRIIFKDKLLGYIQYGIKFTKV